MPLRPATHVRRLPLRLELLGLLFCLVPQACSSTSNDANSKLAPSEGVDASADDAAKDVVDASVPPVDPTPIPACFDGSRCVPSAESPVFERVFDTPEGVEIRSAKGNFLLAFDHVSEQFVTYAPDVDMSNDRLVYGERLRFDRKYDRVMLGSNALACHGSSCELVELWSPGARTTPVPDELQATVVSKQCVGGRGVMCFDYNTGVLVWRVRPEVLQAPVSVFAALTDDDILVIDTEGSASLVRSGVVVPFDVGTSERIVQLAAGYYLNPQEWAGRTEGGMLVRGSLAGGTACNVQVDSLSMSRTTSLAMRQGERLMMGVAGRGTCYAYALPSGILGADLGVCGIAENPFAFDAHQVFAPPAYCMMD